MSLNLHEAAPASPSAAVIERPGLPRVLYVIVLDPSNKFGSMEEQVVMLAHRFQKEGGLFLPLFVCDPGADVSQFHKRDVPAHCLELRRFSWNTLWQLKKLISGQRIEIVNWNFMPSLTNRYVWGLSLLAPQVQHWYTDHNSRPAELSAQPSAVKNLVKRFFLKRYRRVLCVSQFVQDCLEAQGVWSNLLCTKHFINTDRFRPDQDARAYMRRTMNVERRFVLLTVSFLIKEKGIDVAVRALADLPEDVVLWIVGTGPEESELQSLIAGLNLGDRVRLLGLQRHVQPYMQAADCFLCPSLWREAAGLVNLEAQACGKPVVASRIGGIPEYVAHGETGFLFTPGSHQELAECVRKLVDDAGLCDRFAQQARARATELFAPEVGLPIWLDPYRP